MKYEIWQADTDTTKGRYIAFTSYEFASRSNMVPTRDCYNKVYESEVSSDGKDYDILEHLFAKFNLDRPDDFYGRSLSVSDVIILDGQAYYTNNYGFKKIEF